MEHSFLHALELTGLVIALGGVFLVLGLLRPAQRVTGPETQELGRALSATAARWVFHGALIAALATLCNFFVTVAEVQGRTVFSPIDLSVVAQFAAQTHVGRLSLARVGVLILLAVAVRLPGKWQWWLAGAGGFAAVVLTSLVSHAAAQPDERPATIAAQVAHTAAAALWVGVLIHLLAARPAIQGPAGQKGIALVAEMVRRFSPVALTVTSLLGLSGLFMLFRFVGGTAGLGGVFASAYGLTLMVKLLMLVPAVYAGSVNFKVIRPALMALAGAQSSSDSGAGAKTKLLQRFGKMLELEVTSGVLVIMMAGILASVSPPGEEGAYRLTSQQERALLSPRFPTVNVINPATFYGASTRGLDDLRYSEFTHHWSGVMVTLLGLGWLAQSARGRLGHWAAYGWPFLLIPFAAFVAVASDPEVWFLRRVSIWQAIGDPALLEHQLGAVMILALVWLGWRDHRKPAENRPLGYSLPVILMMGGVLLLGHAHSTLTVTDDVTNLINYQHAIFGAFILCGGAIRWLSLRGLVPSRAANAAWPCFIIGLGLFMTFFYRETV
jgi:putative copper export protein